MVVSLLDDEHLSETPARMLARRFAVWTVLCFFGALPSFILALLAEADPRGLVLGVFIFVLLLTAASCTETFNRLKRQPAWRRAIRITFMFRVAMTVLAPFGWILDAMAGVVSMMVAQALGNEIMEAGFGSFTITLITTLTQGSLLLGMLLLLLLIVHSSVAKSTPVPDHLKGLCAGCGYDLRGSGGAGVCPECGTIS